MKRRHKHKVLLAELSMTGGFHSGVNAGFVLLMQESYPESELHFLGEGTHIESCRNRLAGTPVRYRKFPVFPKAGQFTLPLRDLLGCMYAVWLFLLSGKTDPIFITNLLPFTHWCMYLLNGLFRRQLFIALHGQLEAFCWDTSLRLTKPYFRLHGPLFRKDRRNRYIILGDPVYKEIEHLFGPEAKIIVIDHPYDCSEPIPAPVLKCPVRFGQIGTGNRAKGTEALFRLGELLCDEIEAGRVELFLTGGLAAELRSRANQWVKWHVAPLSESKFSREINRLHYVLFLRDASQGRATASGSFFDSVKYRKPFLSLDSHFVRHYTERFPGCGETFSSIEALAGAIRGISLRMDKAEYGHRTEGLEVMRRDLSIQRIAEDFKRQIR